MLAGGERSVTTGIALILFSIPEGAAGQASSVALSGLGGLLPLFPVVSQSSTTGYFPLRLRRKEMCGHLWLAACRTVYGGGLLWLTLFRLNRRNQFLDRQFCDLPGIESFEARLP